MVFLFSSLITHHSIFVTHHSSLIIHHLSLKIPQFPQPHPFGTCFQLLVTQFFLLFVGPYLSTISNILVSLPASHHFIISYHSLFISVFNSIPNTLPKPKTSTQAFIFFFSLQPPIPTTTTSVLSLKHKPKKFISILEAPRKFTNPQQPIHCPNC